MTAHSKKVFNDHFAIYFFRCNSFNPVISWKYNRRILVWNNQGKVFLGGSAGKESACNAGDLGLIPGLGRSPGEGNGYPLQYSALENFMDCIVHGVLKSWRRLSDFYTHRQAWAGQRTGNSREHSDCLILSPTGQTPPFPPFLEYWLSTCCKSDTVLDFGDTSLPGALLAVSGGRD